MSKDYNQDLGDIFAPSQTHLYGLNDILWGEKDVGDLGHLGHEATLIFQTAFASPEQRLRGGMITDRDVMHQFIRWGGY